MPYDSTTRAASAVYLTLPRTPQQAGLPIPSIQALAVDPSNQNVYAVNTAEGLLVVGNAGDLTQRQTFVATGANQVAVSPNGNFVLVESATSQSVTVYHRDHTTGDLSAPSTFSDASHNVFQTMAFSPSGNTLYVAGTAGVESLQFSNGTLSSPTFAAKPDGVGSFTDVAVSRDGTLVYAVSPTNNALVVLNAGTLSPISGSPFTVAGAQQVAVSPDVTSGFEDVYVLGGSSATLAVFQRKISSNGISLIQTLVDGQNGVRGLLGGDGLLVSNDLKYVYVTSASGGSIAVFDHETDTNNNPLATLELAQVLRGQPGLDDPAGLASSGGSDGIIYVATQSGLGSSAGGVAIFDPASQSSPPKAHSFTVSYQNINTLTVTTGGSDDLISETHPANAQTLTIDAGDGNNTVNLLDFQGTTTVTTGTGNNNITARSATGGKLTVDAGDGTNFIQLENALAGDVIKLFGDAGNDTFVIAGGALNPSASVTVNGGGGTNTMLFDSTGKPIIAGTNGLPTIPNGTIQIGGNYGEVVYNNIQDIPGYAGATVNAGGSYTIAEGHSLALSGSATPATNSTILSETWDLNGDGVFGDATGYNPTVSWASLVALGLGHPGTYTIDLRVKSDTNTTDDYAQLTITNTAPTLTVNAPSTATLGVPYTITFSGTEVGSDPITGWQVNWGNGTVVNLPSDATSATYTYVANGTEGVTVTAFDANGSYTYPSTFHVTVSPGAQTIHVTGPYTLQSGGSVVLTATTVGSPISFQWDINGNGVFTDVTGSVPSPVNGVTTSQATLTWANLQSLLSNNDAPQTLSNVRVKVTYADATSAISSPTGLTILDTAPTASFSGTNTSQGGSSSVSFTGAFSPSKAETLAGLTYSYDFNDDGSFEIANSTNASASVPASLLLQAGSYVIHGRVSDSAGGYTDDYTTIIVSAVAPTLTSAHNPNFPPSVPAGTTVYLGPVPVPAPAFPAVSLGTLSFTSPGSTDTFSAVINWGDGTSSVGTIVAGMVSGSHAFAPGQTYTVTVNVIDDTNNLTRSTTYQVTMANPIVSVIAGSDQTSDEGSPVSVMATFTDNGAPASHVATINWGDGTITQASESEPGTALDTGAAYGTHDYGKAGDYLVTVSVAEVGFKPISDSLHVTVNNVVPQVNAGPDVAAGVGVPVSVNATFSDPGFPVAGVQETYTATINWGDNTSSQGIVTVTPGTPGVATTGTVTGSHQYSGDGPYTVTVTVGDGTGTGSDTLQVTGAPAVVTPSVLTLSANEGTLVNLPVTFTDLGFNYGGTTKAFTALINWGDGTSSTGIVNVTPGNATTPTQGTISASHTFTTFSSSTPTGTFPISIQVTDEGNVTGTATVNATIKNLAPVAASLPGGSFVLNTDPATLYPNDPAAQAAHPGTPVSLNGIFTDPGIGDTHTITINWGDGTTSVLDDSTKYVASNGQTLLALVEPTATSPGTYTIGHAYYSDATDTSPKTVTVTVTDNGGLASKVSETLEVQPSLAINTSGNVTLGTTAPTLNATAVLSGGDNATGSVIFTLIGPGGTTVDTETVTTVKGDGSYSTPHGYTLPTTGTVTGAYQWNVQYGGDSQNVANSDNNDANGQVEVSSANDTLVSTASPAVMLGTTAPTLSDSVVLAGGYYETGNAVFTLTGPGGFSYTQSDKLTGNGTYSPAMSSPPRARLRAPTPGRSSTPVTPTTLTPSTRAAPPSRPSSARPGRRSSRRPARRSRSGPRRRH